MCEQCLTWPISFGNPLPGFRLMRARRDGHTWKRGEWALIECNDPTYTWKTTPTPSPIYNLSDLEEHKMISALALADTEGAEYKRCMFHPEEFIEALRSGPEAGFKLVSACYEVGYDKKKHGNLDSWLFDYLGEWLKTAEMVDEGGLPGLSPADFTIGKDPLPSELLDTNP